MAQMTVWVSLMMVRDIPDSDDFEGLEVYAKKAVDELKPCEMIPGYEWIDGEIHLVGLDHDWPEKL